jgi:GNAT superfamily N-acetyltransferase
MISTNPARNRDLTVTVRRVTESDRDALRRFLSELSLQSSFLRFFSGGRHTGEHDLDVLLRRSGTGVAAVAVAGARIVGHGMWAPALDAAGTADLALVVADDHQRRGIGTRLAQFVIADARRRGINDLEAHVLSGNDPVHRMISRLAPRSLWLVDDDVVRYRVRPAAPVPAAA